MANKKVYFWLKLEQNFFQHIAIKQASKIPGGDTMIIVYQKMLLESLKNDGVIFLENVLDDIYQELSLMIDVEVEKVKMAVGFFTKFNLIQFDGIDRIELPQTSTLTGKVKQSSLYQQRWREKKKSLQCRNDVDLLVDECVDTEIELEKEIELEIELEKDIDIEKEIGGVGEREKTNTQATEPAKAVSKPTPKQKSKPVKHKHGSFENVLLTDEELSKLKERYADLDNRIERLSEYVASTGKVYKSHYATIIAWANKDKTTPAQQVVNRYGHKPKVEKMPSWAEKKPIEKETPLEGEELKRMQERIAKLKTSQLGGVT